MNRVGKAIFMKVPSARSVSDKGALTHVLSCPSEKNPANLSICGAFCIRLITGIRRVLLKILQSQLHHYQLSVIFAEVDVTLNSGEDSEDDITSTPTASDIS